MQWKVLGRDAIFLVAAYGCLFGWAVIRVVYQDHEELVIRIASMEKSPPELKADINLTADGGHAKKDGLLLVSVVLVNGIGPPRPIANWKLQASFDSTVIDADPFIPFDNMSSPIIGTKDKIVASKANYCLVVNQDPIPSGSTRVCWMMAIFKGRYREMFEAQKVTAIVSFDDVLIGKRRTITHVCAKGNNLAN